jgi:hypothetical protein
MALLQENQVALPAFALVAEEFCLMIDSFRDGRPENLYTKLELLLAELHSRILPVVRQMNEKEHPELELVGEITQEEWRGVSHMIQDVVSRDTSQLEALFISQAEGEYDDEAARAFLLWDDLADIYLEIRRGLALWKLGTVEGKVEASWHWRFDYESHWGHHLANGMKTVHEIRYRLNED